MGLSLGDYSIHCIYFCVLQVSAWGGYVFIINLIPLHVFALLLMGRYSPRIYTAYTTFFILGLLLSMQVPFVGFQPIRTSEHMASAGQCRNLSSKRPRSWEASISAPCILASTRGGYSGNYRKLSSLQRLRTREIPPYWHTQGFSFYIVQERVPLYDYVPPVNLWHFSSGLLK